MKLRTLLLVAAICGCSHMATAAPPPHSRQMARPQVTTPRAVPNSTPSLSSATAALNRKSSFPGHNTTGNWHTASAGNRRPSNSMIPGAAAYRPGSNATVQNPSAMIRPNQNPTIARPHRGGGVNLRPEVVVNRPDINPYRNDTSRAAANYYNAQRNAAIQNTTVINQNANQPVNNYQRNNYRANHYGNYQANPYRQRDYYHSLHHHWQPSTWSAAYQPAWYNYNNTYAVNNGAWIGVGNTNYAYVNPFYARAQETVAAWFDYSQPIHIPQPNYQETNDDLIRSERAIRRFDDARELFRRGEYGRANDLIDEAIEWLPSDPTLHQFRALVLFARQRYQDAAAALYSVLAVSSGWNADTIARLYDGPQRYLEQVSELEQFVISHPGSNDARFLLAYHMAIKGDRAASASLLATVREANPNDLVVESLLSALAAQQ